MKVAVKWVLIINTKMVPSFLIFLTILRVVAGVEGKGKYVGTLKSIGDPNFCSSVGVKSQELGKRTSTITSALPETAASVVIATTVVGAAATFLVQRRKAPNETEVPLKTCEDCGGSGICSECKGEGFVLKKQSEETAQRARTTAKNMATRFTAGLPKKWSYCTKCSSARSCSICGGRGKISY